MIKPKDRICIRKSGIFFRIQRNRGNALLLKTLCESLRRDPFQIRADGDRRFQKGRCKNLFCAFLSVIADPLRNDPFRHRVAHRPGFYGIDALLWICKLIQTARNTAQYPVHETGQLSEALFLRKLYRLVAGGGCRYTVHIFQLVYAHPENGADHRFHFSDLYF